jgi:hypothetical protein
MLAYKRRVRSADALDVLGRPFEWHIHVMNLSDMEPIPLGETRDIDDQVEWLDDSHVLYGYDDPTTGVTSIYAASTDGAAPTLYAASAESPSVISHPLAVGATSD